ncbi:MAG: TraR/DksA family transcriptional regulator [Lentisphaeria bacterium]|nr:TraR/DksA family transcriptional regulator [Lentisphaeria bacterium]
MATKNKSVSELSGRNKKFYDLLMQYRDKVTDQMKYHVEDALSIDNNDKRGVTTHMADMGSDNSRHEMELSMLTEEGNVLQLIENALKRIIEGNYGKCQDCGEDIPEARLEVRPYAVYCVKCKTIREKNGGFNPNV